MDAKDIIEVMNEHRGTAAAVLAAGSGAIGWLASWWHNRPRIIAHDRAGGRKAFKELPRAQRRRMIRDARRGR